MHILYVDESGDDGFAPGNVYTNPDAQSKVFIRTGLAVHDRRWRKLNQNITALKYKYKIPNSVELHATEIRRGKNRIYDKKTGKKREVPNWFGENYPEFTDRMSIINDLCTLIHDSPDISIISIVIDKQKINPSVLPDSKQPKNASWEMLIERYNLYLEGQKDKIGIIISDAIQDKIEKVHREFARAIYEKSLHVQQFHFVESILFEPSDSSNLLQLVDIASYAIYKKFNQDDDGLYSLIKDRLFCNSSGCIDGAGLKIWP